MQSWRETFIEEPLEQHRLHEEIYDALRSRDAGHAIELIVHHHSHFHDLEKYYPIEVPFPWQKLNARTPRPHPQECRCGPFFARKRAGQYSIFPSKAWAVSPVR